MPTYITSCPSQPFGPLVNRIAFRKFLSFQMSLKEKVPTKLCQEILYQASCPGSFQLEVDS